jgi:hypothetical protein
MVTTIIVLEVSHKAGGLGESRSISWHLMGTTILILIWKVGAKDIARSNYIERFWCTFVAGMCCILFDLMLND